MAVSPILRILSGPVELAGAACGRIEEIIDHSLGERGVCSVALSGGETPRAVYRLLAADKYKVSINWTRVHVFFGDERLVPPDDPESNFGMAQSTMLSRLPIPPGNINRVRGELPAGQAVEEYRRRVKEFFGDGPAMFDLVLLGLGKDGHTASLFPGSDALSESEASVTAVLAPGVKTQRATLTLPVINNARHILFLVTGRSKATIVRDVLAAEHPAPALPATMVRPVNGDVEWVIDSDAASQLTEDVRSLFRSPEQRTGG